MIVNDARGVIIWQPFKCYSTSFGHYFGHRKTGPNWRWVQGESPSTGTNHTNEVDPKWIDEDYEFWLPVRNPYDRVVSAWKFARHKNDDMEWPFREWLDMVVADRRLEPVTKVYHWTRFIPVEHYEREFKRLDCWIPEHPFPHSNKNDKYGHELTKEERDIIWHFQYSDFMTGLYARRV